MNRYPVRVFFEKKDSAVYISHLDLLRTMQRALKRSGLPVWYSEGFKPRIYLNFPLALSLGVEGEREAVDFYLTEDIPFEKTAALLGKACPRGIKVLSAAAPVYENKDIGFADYTVRIKGNGLETAFLAFMGQESIKVMKHSKKKGEVETDIKPYVDIRDISAAENGISVTFRMPAGSELNLNAGTLTDAFVSYCRARDITADILCTKRINILCKSGEKFA
ncbi:MAG: TIGR03936 family radical SAM-associated protein [Ruminococcus sp.]|nr:TIGR03936 family radical SAM-associated protein [Ruminococcus sp.]